MKLVAAMAERAVPPTGSIYDLGYRPYAGERLGRRYAVQSLYIYSLRAIFGLGRSGMSKLFPIGLAVLALIPAAIQLGVAAISPADIRVFKYENYFGFIQIILALFCAVVAPEIIGRDQRHKTLPLYFSRALSRADYVSAKVGALFAALFLVSIVPQALLFTGNAVATNDLVSYLQDNADQIPPILASCAVVAIFMAALSLAIASQTPRRALSTGAVLAFFVIFSSLGSILVQTTTGDVQKYTILLSPLDVLSGSTFWLFGATAGADSALTKSGLAGGLYLVASLGYTAVALGFLYRRFQRLAV
jgi:ABC-2 type transport system permease protein